MTLTWPVALAVLFAAFLHAAWNALVKSGQDKALDTAAQNLVGWPLAVGVLVIAGLPAPAAWPWLVGSAAIHVAYFALLAAAYRHGDLALTYPLMRGTAPLLVALVSAAAFAEPLSPAAWVGVLGVCVGIAVLGLSPQALASRRAVALALANSLVIAGYTVVDSHGARASANPAGYVAVLFVLNAVPFALFVVPRRGFATSLQYLRGRAPLAAAGAAASLAAYGIALWAMTRAPVASVAALRETSVLFAVLIGSWTLREKFTARRACGAGAILAGVLALRLG